MGATLLVCGGCSLSGDARRDGSVDATRVEDALGEPSIGEAGALPGQSPWYWVDSSVTENETVDFVGYDQGCADYGPLDELGGSLSFRAGFALVKPPVDRLQHYDVAANREVDDGALAGYAVVGAVLLVRAAKMVTDPVYGDGMITQLAIERFADPGAVSPSGVSIQGTLRVDGLRGCGADEQRCVNIVDPTIVLVWQDSIAGTRAYQFMRPKRNDPSDPDPRFAQCPVTMNGSQSAYSEGLGVYWPLREDFARQLDAAPDPTRWTEWIDQVLPR